MNIFMISLDRGLLGKDPLGDVIARHCEYGKHVSCLDILVLSLKGYKEYSISDRVTSYPVNAKNKFTLPLEAYDLARSLFLKKKYDLIVTQDPYIAGWIGLRLKRKSKTKLLVHLHGDFLDNKYWVSEKPINWFLLQLGKYILTKCDAIRLMSAGQKTKLEKYKRFHLKNKIVKVISTPVDVRRFVNYNNHEYIQKVESQKTEKDNKVVLVVARKDQAKDFETLCRAVHEVYDQGEKVELWLVGNYSEAECKKLPLPPDLPIKCFGRIDTLDLPAYYYVSSLVVLTSTAESFGKVFVEANACRKAVVATKTTGAQEVIQDGYNGFLVPIKDYQALAEKIKYLIQHPKDLEKMGENGQKRALEEFDGAKNTQRIVDLWKEVINKK